MSYITPEYYENEYQGSQPADAADLQRFINRASDIVDQMTDYRLFGKEDWKEGLSELQIALVEKATAAQVEFYVMNGGDAEVNAGTSDMQSVAIGSFSYSGGGQGEMKANRISPSATAFLLSSGLLYRGLATYG
jgi:hypothetical protein